MYPGMVLSTRALPVSASMYSSTHFRQWAEEEEEKEEKEEEEEVRRMRGGGEGGGGGGEQPHSEQRLHAYTIVTSPTREPHNETL